MGQFLVLAELFYNSFSTIGDWLMSQPLYAFGDGLLSLLRGAAWIGLSRPPQWAYDVAETIRDTSLAAILLGGSLTVFLIWRIWKFVKTGIPVIG